MFSYKLWLRSAFEHAKRHTPAGSTLTIRCTGTRRTALAATAEYELRTIDAIHTKSFSHRFGAVLGECEIQLLGPQRIRIAANLDTRVISGPCGDFRKRAQIGCNLDELRIHLRRNFRTSESETKILLLDGVL